jgi:iron complex outermembrane receptor protein
MNLPMTDTLAGRIAFMTDTRDSFYHNVSGAQSTGGKVHTPGDQIDQNMRLSLLWEPNAKLSVYGKLEYTHLEANGIPQQPNPRPYTGFWDDDGDPSTPSLKVTTYGDRSQGPAPGTGFMVDDVWYGGTPGAGGELYDPLDPFVIDRRYENWRIQKNVRQSLEINYELDSGIRLRSLTSNIEMDRKQAEAGDSAAFQDVTGWHLGGPDMRTWSQEFNIISPDDQRLRWLLGAYHSDRHTDLSLNIALDNPDCGWQYDSSWTPCPTSGESQTRLYWTSDDDVKHTGYYVQLNYDVTDDLELTVEARLNKDDNVQLRQLEVPRVQQLLDFGPFAAATELCPGQINGSTFYCTPNAGDLNYPTSPPLVWKDDIMTYKVGLNWEPWDNHFFYIFSARGYKSGQSVTFGAPPVTEEVVDDFELGWKGTVLDGRLYAELGYFNMDYTDMQLSSFVTGVTESTTAVRNAGASSIEGFEGTFRFFVGNLALNGSFGYTDSKLGSIQTIDTRALPIAPPGPGAPWPGNTAQGCTGDFCFDYTPYQLTLNGANGLFSPEWTWTLGADYSFGLSNGASITPAVSFNHSDMANTSIIQQPGDAYFTAEERDIMNLTLTYRNEDWEVQLYGTNVTDEVFIEGTSGASVLYGDPEVWGIRARMEF